MLTDRDPTGSDPLSAATDGVAGGGAGWWSKMGKCGDGKEGVVDVGRVGGGGLGDDTDGFPTDLMPPPVELTIG